MRKVSLILVVLLFVAPAWARVDIKCTVEGDEVTISYRVMEDEPNKVRAFGLDITVDKGTITGYDDTVNDDYVIYPGSIVINTSVPDPCVDDYGTPIGDPCDHPDTQPGLDSNGITIEMGALYAPPDDNSPNAPPDQNDNNFYELLKLIISDLGACVTITENEARGGVVMTDPTIDPDVNATGDCCGEEPYCFPVNDPAYTQQAADYLAYKANSNPAVGIRVDCWCHIVDPNDPKTCINLPCVFQCDGDADGATYGSKKYRVYLGDLNLVVANWKKKITDPTIDPCADVDHVSYGSKKYRVYLGDLNTVVNNWKAKDSNLPGDCPRPDGL